jgi:hypothetical protein
LKAFDLAQAGSWWMVKRCSVGSTKAVIRLSKFSILLGFVERSSTHVAREIDLHDVLCWRVVFLIVIVRFSLTLGCSGAGHYAVRKSWVFAAGVVWLVL